ncbi:hypothetical protein BaRGS_00019487 [Batillaria attramentaria]|uniref:Uncharacterized protein n=1 Tax=Batillaria attramentaria TaxID=370345 RepID=A0ABD0KR82_9CAEN
MGLSSAKENPAHFSSIMVPALRKCAFKALWVIFAMNVVIPSSHGFCTLHLHTTSSFSYRSSGLFLSKYAVRRLRYNRDMADVFVLKSRRNLFRFNGTCNMPQSLVNMDQLPSGCDEPPGTPPGPNNWFGTTDGCCNTQMRVELPQQVTSLITGRTHQVVQFFTSSQLIHTGYCQKEGGMCVLGGTCTTVFRVQWLLVRSAARAAGDDDEADDLGEVDDDDAVRQTNFFVPTMVPNHCQCIFT